MNTTEIKTGEDIKLALEQITAMLEADMAYEVGNFAANLVRVRDRMKAELEKHRKEVDQIANDEYDALQAIGQRIADLRIVTEKLPSHYQLSEIAKLAEAGRQIANIDDVAWARLERIIDATRNPNVTTP